MKLITTALPYANGPLHLGHMVEQIQADVFARACRMLGQKVLFLSGDDAHGVAIMIAAEQKQLDPNEYIKAIYLDHTSDIKNMGIGFDYYGTSHSSTNCEIATAVYESIKSSDWLAVKSIKQPFDAQSNSFLSDRYVRGQCPYCGSEDQYGDGCENCGRAFESYDLKEPYSALTKQPLVWKDTDHAFFELERARNQILNWLEHADLQPAVANKLKEWFKDELRPWDISRNAPYFGFPVPDLDRQFFYVWLDAPCTYLAMLYEWMQKESMGHDWQQLWQESHVTHFVGKDILYHHGLFWPAMLSAAGLKGPDCVFSHGFLTVSGQKMSKSRGTFFTVKAYLDLLPPDYIRYYIAAKLGDGVVDIDLDWEDFAQRINADLVGKLINLGSRLSGFVFKNMSGRMSHTGRYTDFLVQICAEQDKILAFYESKMHSKAIRLIMEFTDKVNQWVSEVKPWSLAKEGDIDHMAEVVTTGLNAYRWLMHMLSPVCPHITSLALSQFGQKPSAEDAQKVIFDCEIGQFVPLGQRVQLDDRKIPVKMV